MKSPFNINNLKNKKHKWRKLILTLSLPLVLIPSTFAVANVNNPGTYSSNNNDVTTSPYTDTTTPIDVFGVTTTDITTTEVTVEYYYIGPSQPIYYSSTVEVDQTPTDWIATTPINTNGTQPNTLSFTPPSSSVNTGLIFLYFASDIQGDNMTTSYWISKGTTKFSHTQITNITPTSFTLSYLYNLSSDGTIVIATSTSVSNNYALNPQPANIEGIAMNTITITIDPYTANPFVPNTTYQLCLFTNDGDLPNDYFTVFIPALITPDNITTTDNSATITYKYLQQTGTGVYYNLYTGDTPNSTWTQVSTPPTNTDFTADNTLTLPDLTSRTTYHISFATDASGDNVGHTYSFTTTGTAPSSGMSGGAIAGIVIGALVGVAAIGGGWYYWDKKRKGNKEIKE